MNQENQDIQARLNRIEQDVQDSFKQLNKRLDELNQKHSALVDYVVNAGSTDVDQAKSTINAPDNASQSQTPEIKTAASRVSSSTQTDFFSSKLLPLAAVFCFLIAAVFITKLAMSSGFLTKERQWGLVMLLGFSSVGYGLFGPLIDDLKYRSYLAGAGVIILFIAALSSFLYFGLFSFDFSVVLVILFSILSIYLSKELQSEVFLVVAILGTYLAPVLVGETKDFDFFVMYFSITSMAYSFIAAKLQSRVMAMISSYFGIGAFAYLNQNISASTDIWVVVAVQTLQFLSFTFGTYYHSVVHKSPLTQKMAMMFLPVLLFFYATIYYFLDKLGGNWAPWISLGFAGFLLLLYYRAKQKIEHIESEEMIFGFVTVVIAHSGYHQLLPGVAKPWLIPCFILLNLIADQKHELPVLSRIISKVMWIIGGIEFFSMCGKLFALAFDLKLMLPAFFTLALGIYFYFRKHENLKNKESVFLGLIHVLSILFLYRLAFDFGTLAVSAAWAVYSLIILGLGYQKKMVFLAKSSLLVLVLVGMKALVFDASQAATGVRIVSLLLTGVVLFAAGLILKKINQFPKETT